LLVWASGDRHGPIYKSVFCFCFSKKKLFFLHPLARGPARDGAHAGADGGAEQHRTADERGDGGAKLLFR
jgi:hypothetical protein